MRHVLDDPAWHAFAGPLARFADGAGAVRRASGAHSFFTAVDPAAPVEDVARDLAALAAPGERLVFVGAPPRVPDGVVELGRGDAHQMVLEDRAALRAGRAAAAGRTALDVVSLTASDAPEMVALVDHARPGPFLLRTIELGNYVGIRDASGALVAMAGERLRPPGYVEISAVSVHESQRRRGLATLVVAAVAESALARGEQPFLHVVTSNVAAIPVYERLGFRTRTMVQFVAAQRPDAPHA